MLAAAPQMQQKMPNADGLLTRDEFAEKNGNPHFKSSVTLCHRASGRPTDEKTD